MNPGGDAAVLRIVLEDGGGTTSGGSGTSSTGHATGQQFDPEGWRDVPTRRADGSLDWSGTRRVTTGRIAPAGETRTIAATTTQPVPLPQPQSPTAQQSQFQNNFMRQMHLWQISTMFNQVGLPGVGNTIRFAGQTVNAAHFVGQAGQAATRGLGMGAGAGSLAFAGAAAVTVVGITAAASMQFAKSMSERARELSAYSGQIAMSVAMAEVRQIQADIREAQILGSRYSDITDSWSRFQVSIQEFMIPIKKVLLDIATPLMEWLNKLLDTGTGITSQILNYADTFARFWGNAIIFDWKAAQDALEEGKKAAMAIANRHKDKADLELEWLKQFFAFADNAPHMWPRGADALDKARDQKLNIPAFAGIN